MAIYLPGTAIWSNWIGYTTSESTTSGSSIITTDYDPFHTWVTDSTASTATTSVIYSYWIDEYQTAQINRAKMLRLDVERQQRCQELVEQQRREFEQRQQQQSSARRKAKILLLENLDQEQQKEFKKEGFFFVKSPSGRLYRIREGRSINIDLMKGNSRIEVEKRLCAHPEIACPNEDTMLAQKIYLEKMEQEFLRIARPYGPPGGH
jgi:hypothetical protein